MAVAMVLSMCTFVAYAAEGDVTLDKAGVTLVVDKSKTATVKATLSGDALNVTGAEFKWSSDNSSVVTVSGNGNTATLTAVAKGTAKVSVAYGDDSAYCDVTVLDSTDLTKVTCDKTVTVGLNISKAALGTMLSKLAVKLYYGETVINGTYDKWDISEVNTKKADTYYAYAKDVGEATSVKVKVVSNEYLDEDDDPFDMGTGKTLASIFNQISDKLESLYGKPLFSVDLDSISNKGGTLYVDDDCEEIVEEDEGLTRSDVNAMYFAPDGTGKIVEIDYKAFTEDESMYVAGVICLQGDTFFLLEGKADAEDTVELGLLDAAQDAVSDLLDTSKYTYEVSYIKFTSLGSNGTLYCGDTKTANKVKTTTKYYADDEDLLIDDIIFAAGKYDGVYEAKFTVTAIRSDNKKYTETVDGILRINVTTPADITVNATYAKPGMINAKDFEKFYDNWFKSLSSKKQKQYADYEIAYVKFSNAPGSTTDGYLYEGYGSSYYGGNTKITTPDSKKFYYGEEINKGYDLENITWAPAKNTKTFRGTFEIFCYDEDGDLMKTSMCEGVIEWSVDGGSNTNPSAVTVSKTIKASELYKTFYSDFAGYSYVVFTAQPVGGKLVYNFGKDTQTDVKLNTPYYLGASSTGLYLTGVSFVPTYGTTSGKVSAQGYAANGKSVKADFVFTVTPVTSSMYFTDVAAYSSYIDSIDFLYNIGLTTGTATGVYSPAKTMTRGEWVTMLYRAAGSPAVSGTNPFKDVPAWCKDAVQWAKSKGITDGTSATTFNPNGILTRQEIVQFMYNWAVVCNKRDGSGIASLASYADGASVANWAQTSMKWALKNSYVSLTADSKINPTGTANRAEVADFAQRLLTK